MRACILSLTAFVLILIGLTSGHAQSRETRAQIEASRLELQQVEAALQREGLNDEALAELRRRVEPLLGAAAEIVGREAPRLDEIKVRLEQLGPKPEAGAPAESAEVVREREEQEKARQEIDELLRSARLLSVSADQVQQAIQDRRRRLFASAILERTQSVVSPWLWLDVVQRLPREVRALNFVAGEWADRISREMTAAKAVLLALLVMVAIGGIALSRALVRRFGRQDEVVADPSRLQRASAALRVALVYAVVPSLVFFLIYEGLSVLDMLPGRIDQIARVLLSGLALLFFLRGLAFGTLAVDRPAWRFFPLNDAHAARLLALVTSTALVLLAAKTVEAINQAIVAALPLTLASKGAFTALAALIIFRALSGFSRRADETEEAVEPASAEGIGFGMPLRVVTWAVAAVILAAALAGYIALAAFVLDQFVFVAALGAVVALLVTLIDEAIGKGLSSEGRLGRELRNATGLARGSVDQIGVLSAGLLRLLLFVAAGMLVLAPWGVESGDLLGSLRAAFFGFQVGNVTISLSTIVLALVLFIGGFFVTRALQRWLETRYLPHTSLDPGLRNSISTIFGYIGVVIAAALALGQLGLSLDRIALVAGALSVGIGFGLQSIVNNFVSGLILLWERPLRVGDWIVVGTEQGKVKRINVRATEIETFDKASLIVPNSAFISGQVKNFVHNDRTGRIIIPLSVDYTSDPEQVRALLNEAALGHREVLTTPKHVVIFKNFGESSLDFELICFADIDAIFTVRSELLFDIFRRLKAEGIEIPFPRRTVEISNLPQLEAAISGSSAQQDTVERPKRKSA